MTNTVQERTRRAFLLVLLLPALLGIATIGLQQKSAEDFRWVSHTQQVLLSVTQVVTEAYRAESNQRGYLLSGDASFLDAYKRHTAAEWQTLKNFQRLTRDNPVQQNNAAKLLPIWTERAQLMERVLEARKSGPLDPRSISLLVVGRTLMDRMTTAADQMRNEENRLLLERQARYRTTQSLLIAVFVAAILINVALLYWANHLIAEYGVARDKAESDLRSVNAELERRVAERTAELATANENLLRSNQDLTRFAYIASHDLQEPLRTVGSYAGLLARRYEGKLDAQADKYISFIVSGAKRMQNMVQDLLAYSRTGTQQLSFTKFDLNRTVDVVEQNLSMALQESGGRIIRSELPSLTGDESKITMVLQNLISNALKFRAPERKPIITISARQTAGESVISVRDNGIGFDAQYADRIFVIFQRLHQVGEYPGTGIGLAICKRIIEGHGGRIWADSVPGEGSVFSFSIPADPQRLPISDNEAAATSA